MKDPKDERVFKLVFSAEDGSFQYAEAPEGKELELITYENIHDYIMLDKKNKKEVYFKDLLLTGKRESIKMVDLPGNSICGVVVGGRAYGWC